MKNRKIFTATITLLAFAFVAFVPAFADADSLKLNLGISGKTDVSDDKDDVIKVRVNAQTRATTSYGIQLPPGVERAPGIIKRIEEKKGLPKGVLTWFERFNKRSTTTVDVSLPTVRNIDVFSGTTTAKVTWNTNELTSGEVRFGTTTPVDVNSSLVVDSSMSTSHTVILTGLSADTKYYFTITAKDASGNTKTTSMVRFHTKALSNDFVAPSIYFSTALDTKMTSTRIVWVTNERSDSKIWVGTVNPVNIGATTTVSSSNLVYVHDLVVRGLIPGTLYYYAVKSADADGNLSTTATGSFTTDTN